MLVLLASASLARMELSAYFVIPYCCVGLIQFLFGVSILIYFFCLFALAMLADANRTSMTNTYCMYTVLRYS